MEKKIKKKKEEKIDKVRRKLIKMGIWTVPLIIAFTQRKLWAGTPFGKKGKDEFFEENEQGEDKF